MRARETEVPCEDPPCPLRPLFTTIAVLAAQTQFEPIPMGIEDCGAWHGRLFNEPRMRIVMDLIKTPWARLCLAIAVSAIVVVVVKDRLRAGEESAWERFAEARISGFTADNLENARREVEGTSAEPWVAYQLAMLLYGDGADMDRARQVATAALESQPGHATAPMLSRLILAIDSYSGGT